MSLLKSNTKVIVPYLGIRNALVQKELGEKRANWMTFLQEYDLEIKPTKIVRGQGLCKLVVESRDLKEEEHGWENEDLIFEKLNLLHSNSYKLLVL